MRLSVNARPEAIFLSIVFLEADMAWDVGERIPAIFVGKIGKVVSAVELVIICTTG